jgi:tRNA A-37 threonylcarbamoyl transferase component Bud32
VSLNLPLPPLNSAELLDPPPTPTRRRNAITLHPRYAVWLRKAGLDTAEAVLELTGEIVSGHPDRHVVRVVWPGPDGRRVLYLKREHVIGWRVRLKNYRAGFGWVSRSEREAMTLQSLEACGLPGPQWLAYGTADDGRAFLLVDDLAGQVGLRAVLKDPRLTPAGRKKLAGVLGRSVAELHAAGFGPPDLSAKHVFVDRTFEKVTVIDWQSAPHVGPVILDARVRALALLHATVSESLASARDRLRVVLSYSRTLPERIRPPSRAFYRAVVRNSRRLNRLSSVRDQRAEARRADDLRLTWLAGEAVCVVPGLVPQWPNPPVDLPFYPGPLDAVADAAEQYVGLPDGRTATLYRYTTYAPIDRIWHRLRGRAWRSPATHVARTLFQLQRFDAPAPRLLAFGQRLTSPTRAESFVLTDRAPGDEPLGDRLARPFPGPLDRFLFLRQCGRAVRAVHDAGCRLSRSYPDSLPLVITPNDGILINAPAAVERVRHLSTRDRFADVQRVLFAVYDGTTKSDRLRIALGYLDDTGGLPVRWRRAVARLIGN